MSPYAMLHDNSNYFNKRSGFRNIINPATLDLNEPITIPGSMMNGYAGIQVINRSFFHPWNLALSLSFFRIFSDEREKLPFLH